MASRGLPLYILGCQALTSHGAALEFYSADEVVAIRFCASPLPCGMPTAHPGGVGDTGGRREENQPPPPSQPGGTATVTASVMMGALEPNRGGPTSEPPQQPGRLPWQQKPT